MDFTKDSVAKLIETIKANATPTDGGLEVFNSALATLMNDAQDTLQSLSVATGEAIERKKKIRKINSDYEDLKIENDELKQQDGLESMQAEIAKLQEYKASVVKQRTVSFGEHINTVKSHEKFEKAKDLFKLPTPSDDGSFDVSKMSEEDLAHNLTKMEELKKLDYFGQVATKPKDVDLSKGKPSGTLAERLANAKTHQELELIQAEM
jgi:hypothetical protein